MNLLNRLWRDEAGVLLSTEAVVVGTVGVVGLTAGASALSTAVNEELKDVAFAIRSLDQSYQIPGQKGCGAWTAGSCYQQEPVKESLRELQKEIQEVEAEEERQEKRLRKQLDKQRKRGKRDQARMEGAEQSNATASVDGDLDSVTDSSEDVI